MGLIINKENKIILENILDKLVDKSECNFCGRDLTKPDDSKKCGCKVKNK